MFIDPLILTFVVVKGDTSEQVSCTCFQNKSTLLSRNKPLMHVYEKLITIGP
jgi:hypothetical protein